MSMTSKSVFRFQFQGRPAIGCFSRTLAPRGRDNGDGLEVTAIRCNLLRCDIKGPIHDPSPLIPPPVCGRSASPSLRAMVGGNHADPADSIWPIFRAAGTGSRNRSRRCPAYPAQCRPRGRKAARQAHAFGIPAICIFPYNARTTGPRIAPRLEPRQPVQPARSGNQVGGARGSRVMTISRSTQNIKTARRLCRGGRKIVNDRTVEATFRWRWPGRWPARYPGPFGHAWTAPYRADPNRIGKARGFKKVYRSCLTPRNTPSAFYGPFRMR